MKKKWIAVLLILSMLLCVTGCADTTKAVGSATEEEEGEVSLAYTADFYDNFGGRWLSVEGKTFSISPNKIKTYSWDSDGSWISNYDETGINKEVKKNVMDGSIARQIRNADCG